MKRIYANKRIRAAALENDVELWRLATALDISAFTLSHKMSQELPENEQDRLISVIEQIGKERRA